MDDFLARKAENLSSLLLEKCEAEVKWQLSVPLWDLLKDVIQRLVPDFESYVNTFTGLFAESTVNLHFESANAVGKTLVSTATAATLFDLLRTQIREPLECSPPLMQQLQNSLEFYLPSLSIVGRVQSLGFEVKGSLPKLASLLTYDKTFPFL